MRANESDLENVTTQETVEVPPTETPKKLRAGKKSGTMKKHAKSKTKAAKKSAKPTTKKAKSPQAQSGAALELTFDKMNEVEQKIVSAVYSRKGERKAYSIKELMAVVGAKKSLPVRNGLRRPVRSRWLEKFDRGTYRITEAGRKRGLSHKGA